MRNVLVVIPVSQLDLVKQVLNILDAKYFVVKDENNAVIIIPVSVAESERIIEGLEKVGVGKIYGTLLVHNVEYLPAKLEEKKIPRASREEIEADISSISAPNANFVIYSVCASILAAIALLTENILILIASITKSCLLLYPYLPLLTTSSIIFASSSGIPTFTHPFLGIVLYHV